MAPKTRIAAIVISHSVKPAWFNIGWKKKKDRNTSQT